MCLQFGYALAFWLARTTRAASLRAIEQLQRATRLPRCASRSSPRRATISIARSRSAARAGSPAPSSAAGSSAHVLGRGGDGRGLRGEPRRHERARPRSSCCAASSWSIACTSSGSCARSARRARSTRRTSCACSRRRPRRAGPVPRDGAAARRDAGDAAARRRHARSRAAWSSSSRQLGGVLELARVAGIVHRDIKPHEHLPHRRRHVEAARLRRRACSAIARAR